MFRIPNTYTAVLICFAFMFRLLVVNITLVSTDSHAQHKQLVKSYSSTVLKRGRRFEAVHTRQAEYPVAMAEMCEEPAGDTVRLKFIPDLFNNILHAVVAHFRHTQSGLHTFCKSFSYQASRPYLTLQVIRV